MSTESAELRRYLLGDLPEDRMASLEQDYFARQDTLDRVAAVEDDLIDGYLAGRLTREELSRFERHYLASPVHRARVAIAREIAGVQAQPVPVSAPRPWRTLFRSVRASDQTALAWAFAAGIVLVAGAATWWLSSRPAPGVATGPAAAAPPRPPAARVQEPERTPIVVALSISPLSVRGSDEAATLTIASGTDLVVLRLEGDASAPVPSRGRVIVRTVSGSEIWRGSAVSERGRDADAHMRVEIPAAAFVPDDYLIELVEPDPKRGELEAYRYFLRVRAAR
jgi:hypothetical protein